MSPDLKLDKSGGAPAEGWSCPSCGATMPNGAVLCINCGYDKRTGRRLGDKTAPLFVTSRLITIALGLGLIGAAVYIVLTRTPEKPTASAPLPAAVSPTTMARTVASAARANGSTSAVSASGAPVVSTNQLIELDPQQEQRARDSLARRVDQRFPPYAIGETVALRLTNGIVRRGMFAGLLASNVVLAVGSNEADRVQIESLDIASRLRADPDYRARYIVYWSQHGLKKAAGPP